MLGLAKLGLKEVQDVRIGKHISLELEASSREERPGRWKVTAENCWPG